MRRSRSSALGLRAPGLVALVVAVLVAAVACVDGATPDCSIPAACAPSEGDIPIVGSVDATADSSDARSNAETSAPRDGASDANADGG